MLGVDLAGNRLDDPQEPVALVDQHRDRGADEPVRDRVAGRPEPDAGQLVDPAGERLQAHLQAQRRQLTEQLSLGGEPLARDRVDLTVATAVDLLAPCRGAGVEPSDALGPRIVLELEGDQ